MMKKKTIISIQRKINWLKIYYEKVAVAAAINK